MKKLVSALLALLLALSVLPCAIGEDAPLTPAWQRMNDITIGWNLGNTFDAFDKNEFGSAGLSSETIWGNPYTKKPLFELLRSLGFDTVRIPVTWYTHMDENYTVDPAWMARVHEVVDMALECDMYVILNIHHDTGEKGWLHASKTGLEENKRIFTLLWQQIAESFRDYDDRLMFENFNEILDEFNSWSGANAVSGPITNELSQLFVDTVRATGGNNDERILVINTYCAGGSSNTVNAFVLPADSAEGCLIAGVHMYVPYHFTAGEYPRTTGWKPNDIDTYFKNVYNAFISKGIPCLAGEFGAEDKQNDYERETWAKYYVKTALDLGIKCLWWDNGSGFRLVNRRSGTVAFPYLIDVMVRTAQGEDVEVTLRDGADDANLCSDDTKWNLWVDKSQGGLADIDYDSGVVSITVQKPGASPWHVQPTYSYITLEKGADYSVEFDVSASRALTFDYYFQQSYGSYSAYAGGSVDADTQTVHVTQTFTMDSNTDERVALVFNIGAQEGDTPYTVNISGLRLVKN